MPIWVELRKGTAVVMQWPESSAAVCEVPGCASGLGDPGRSPLLWVVSLDLRAGTNMILVQIVQMFGEAYPQFVICFSLHGT